MLVKAEGNRLFLGQYNAEAEDWWRHQAGRSVSIRSHLAYVRDGGVRR